MPRNRIVSLWERMGAFYGHRWASSYGMNPDGIAAATWAVGLGDLSPEQLATGLHACMRSADGWPPSMQEFRASCFGIPAFGDVVEQLRAGYPDPLPFVRLIWTFLDAYSLRHSDARTERAMMKEAYERATRFVLAGGKLPEKSLSLSHDESAERARYEAIHFERYNGFQNVASDPPIRE